MINVERTYYLRKLEVEIINEILPLCKYCISEDRRNYFEEMKDSKK